MATSKRKQTIEKAKRSYSRSKSFILDNYKTIIRTGIAIFLLYWIIFVLTPSVKMSEESKAKIEDLNSHIDSLQAIQKKLDEEIKAFNQEIVKVDKVISNIKQEKIIIKEIYHEKISNVDNYTNDELDSFFAKRYGYSH